MFQEVAKDVAEQSKASSDIHWLARPPTRFVYPDLPSHRTARVNTAHANHPDTRNLNNEKEEETRIHGYE